ncbi:MAG: hypothetical protein KatS3mg008_0969 [Acidimicrobiales bacterium]|nr:MAG: hypothetical protein KatS3mg008_0969 [Acidimicrobiales bacterium]
MTNGVTGKHDRLQELLEAVNELRSEVESLRRRLASSVQTEHLVVTRGGAKLLMDATRGGVRIRLEADGGDYALELFAEVGDADERGHAGLAISHRGETKVVVETVGDDPLIWCGPDGRDV